MELVASQRLLIFGVHTFLYDITWTPFMTMCYFVTSFFNAESLYPKTDINTHTHRSENPKLPFID